MYVCARARCADARAALTCTLSARVTVLCVYSLTLCKFGVSVLFFDLDSPSFCESLRPRRRGAPSLGGDGHVPGALRARPQH